jgi:di/tricarboxylate transporter
MSESLILVCILIGTIGLFIWGYYRYDVVALMTLLALVLTGLVPSSEAFVGFGNPAVITVAGVMVITAAVSQTGIVEQLMHLLTPMMKRPIWHIGSLCLIGASLSAFMNNVGAIALLMPIAIQSAAQAKLSPSKILMPLSFATVLGGMCTKIGTPPNLLISAYREQISGSPFSMFDYTPVGLSVAVIGLIYVGCIGWRYIPERRKALKNSSDFYQINDYISEITIPEGSPVIDMTRHELENLIEGDFTILGLIRNRSKRLAIPETEKLAVKDILIIEANHEDLSALLNKGKLELVHGDIISPDLLKGEDITVIEAVVTPGTRLEGRSWQLARIRSTLQLNLLAIARAGQAIKNRLNHVNFRVGDVLLIQGKAEDLNEKVVNLGLVPIAERPITIGFKQSTVITVVLFALGILTSSLQWLEVPVAFTLVMVLMIMFNIIPVRRVYRSIDWSIIILLGALIPLGNALQTSGAAENIGQAILSISGLNSPFIVLCLILIITMTLSDIMNNAATTVVMAPIALSISAAIGQPIEPYLMAVAIGASCSFLTPISHQNNTIIMGPGGYKFFDYMWLGLPVELIVLCVAPPTLYFFWM